MQCVETFILALQKKKHQTGKVVQEEDLKLSPHVSKLGGQQLYNIGL